MKKSGPGNGSAARSHWGAPDWGLSAVGTGPGVVAAAIAVLAAAPLVAQTPEPPTLLDVSHSTATAVVTALPRGSASDPEGLEGTSWVVAQALAADARSRLRHLPARVTARVERGRTVFTVLTVPDRWRTARTTLADVLFASAPTGSSVERARADLLEQLRFEEGAPIREFQLETRRFFLGAAHPWARPERGFLVTVERIDHDVASALHAEVYSAADAVTVVAGPGVEDAAGAPPAGSEAADTVPDEGGAPADDRAGSPAPADSTAPRETRVENPGTPQAPGPAWYTGDRMGIERQVTSTWLGIGFPVDPSLPRTRLEFLAQTVRDILVTDPPDPGLFGARIQVDDTPEGAVLGIEVTTVPEDAARWESLVLSTIRGLANREPVPSEFGMRRRRFRSQALLERAPVSGLAHSVAMDLLRNAEPRDLSKEIQALEPGALRSAAAALGEPRVLVYGPDMSDR